MDTSFVIFAQEPSRIARISNQNVAFFAVESDLTESIKHWAVAIHKRLHDAGYDGSGVVLAIPSSWCMAASVLAGDLPRRNRRSLMIYRLEEQLPVAAEDLAIDFCLGTSHLSIKKPLERVLGVSTDWSRLNSLIQALESQSIYVQSIAPAALLAIQHLNQTRASPLATAQVTIWAHGNSSDEPSVRCYEFVETLADALLSWTTLRDIDSILLHLRQANLVHGTAVLLVTIGLTELERSQLSALEEVEGLEQGDAFCEPSPSSPGSTGCAMIQSASIAGAWILAGKCGAPIEFRRDTLASPKPLLRIRKPLGFALMALVAFSLSLAASMLMIAHAYNRRAETYQTLERALYREATEGQNPLGSPIVNQLGREDRRLQALSGTFSGAFGDRAPGSVGIQGPSAGVLRRPRSALAMLAEVLKGMPLHLRYRILEIQLSPQQVQIDGQSRTHSDADAIADGLRSVGGYIVDPPHSEVHGNTPGVSFNILARPLEISPNSSKAPGGSTR